VEQDVLPFCFSVEYDSFVSRNYVLAAKDK